MIETTDIQSLTSFRQKAGEHLAQIKETGRPKVLTVNGEAAGVVLSPQAYDELMQEVEMARLDAMIQRSEVDIKAGRTRPMREALKEMIEKRGGKVPE